MSTLVHQIGEVIAERRRRHSTSMRHRSALAATIRRWLEPRPALGVSGPPAAAVLRSHRDLAQRIADGLAADTVGPQAVAVVEQLLTSARPRTDDLRRAVFLVETSFRNPQAA